jgi:hypothetical protein
VLAVLWGLRFDFPNKQALTPSLLDLLLDLLSDLRFGVGRIGPIMMSTDMNLRSHLCCLGCWERDPPIIVHVHREHLLALACHGSQNMLRLVHNETSRAFEFSHLPMALVLLKVR